MNVTYWLVVGAVWLVGAFGSGAVLAWFFKRLYPSLAFYKLWALWTMIASVLAALILTIG